LQVFYLAFPLFPKSMPKSFYFLLVSLSASLPINLKACPLGEKHLPITYEVAFNNEANPELVITKLIAQASSSIHLAAFAFSSPVIVKALREASQRGIIVQLVIDKKHNIEGDESGIGKRAARSVADAGGIVRTNGKYRLHHDKYIIIDKCHIQTGSWNYASSARRNSENILILRNAPDLAEAYLRHWQLRFDQGVSFK